MSTLVDTERARALDRLTGTWERRCQARRFVLPSRERFDASKPDFPQELLPFAEHPVFLAAPEPERSRICTLGWIAYNSKTVDIEKGILTPACVAIFEGRLPSGVTDDASRRAAVQTLVDETYHVLITHHAQALARLERDLDWVVLPHCRTVESMRRLQARYPERWKKDLILVATAIVTEIFICDHLRTISGASGIQPLNVETTRAHLLDELCHARQFRILAEILLARMSSREREFFLSVVTHPVDWFADRDFDTWEALLTQIRLHGSRELIGDCRAERKRTVDYAPLIALLEDVGVADARAWIPQ